MAWSLIAHNIAALRVSPVVTINSTGADLLICSVTQFSGAAAGIGTLTENKSNGAPTGLTARSSTIAYNRLYYWKNPSSVGSSHSFTYSNGADIFGTVAVQAWSGSDLTAPFDQQNGAVATLASTLATGSITPTTNGQLIIAGFCATDNSGVDSIDSSFTLDDQAAWTVGVNEGGAMAHFIQSSAGALNPTWTTTGSTANLAATIASFKVAAGAGGTPLFLPPRMNGLGSGGPFFSNPIG